MSTRRITRVNELIRREIGTALFRVLNEEGLDLSVVTITHVITSKDLRKAQVLVSIRENHPQRHSIMAMIRHHRVDIQDIIAKNIILKYTPKLSFSLDTSLEKGDHVLDILREIEGQTDNDIP